MILRLSADLIVAQQHVLGDLLGDGGGADRSAAAPDLREVGDAGAQDRHGIDPAMHPEILVLGGDERPFHQVGDGGVGGKDAPFRRELGH